MSEKKCNNCNSKLDVYGFSGYKELPGNKWEKWKWCYVCESYYAPDDIDNTLK